MDTGSACSRYNIYGQMVYLGSYTVDTYNGTFTAYYLNYLLLYGVWMFTTWRWSYILRQVDDFTGRYHDDVNINYWNFYLLHTSHVTKTVSSSDVAIIDVCIYSGQRFAPINIPNYAGSVGKTIFFLWHTCAMSCHVLYYNMPLYNLACYCSMLLYVCT